MPSTKELRADYDAATRAVTVAASELERRRQIRKIARDKHSSALIAERDLASTNTN